MLSLFLIKAVLAGAAWNLLNIGLLKRLAVLLGGETPRRGRKMVFLLLAKFGLLYPAGIWLLWSGAVHRIGFAVGFTAVLIASMAVLMRPPPAKLKVSHV